MLLGYMLQSRIDRDSNPGAYNYTLLLVLFSTTLSVRADPNVASCT